MTHQLEQRLRHGYAFQGYNEISVGMGSRQSHPSSVSDIPVAGSDVVTLLNEEASYMGRGDMTDPYAVTKYILTMQAFHPVVNQSLLKLGLSHVEDRLTQIVDDYDLSTEVLADNAFLNINYWGAMKGTVARWFDWYLIHYLGRHSFQ
jgi:hypothetical protein